MTQKLLEAMEDLICTHSVLQLIPYENLIREVYNLMQPAPLADLEDVLEEIEIAKAENAAYMNGVAEGNEPYFQNDDSIPNDAYLSDEEYYHIWIEQTL